MSSPGPTCVPAPLYHMGSPHSTTATLCSELPQHHMWVPPHPAAPHRLAGALPTQPHTSLITCSPAASYCRLLQDCGLHHTTLSYSVFRTREPRDPSCISRQRDEESSSQGEPSVCRLTLCELHITWSCQLNSPSPGCSQVRNVNAGVHYSTP